MIGEEKPTEPDHDHTTLGPLRGRFLSRSHANAPLPGPLSAFEDRLEPARNPLHGRSYLAGRARPLRDPRRVAERRSVRLGSSLTRSSPVAVVVPPRRRSFAATASTRLRWRADRLSRALASSCSSTRAICEWCSAAGAHTGSSPTWRCGRRERDLDVPIRTGQPPGAPLLLAPGRVRGGARRRAASHRPSRRAARPLARLVGHGPCASRTSASTAGPRSRSAPSKATRSCAPTTAGGTGRAARAPPSRSWPTRRAFPPRRARPRFAARSATGWSGSRSRSRAGRCPTFPSSKPRTGTR